MLHRTYGNYLFRKTSTFSSIARNFFFGTVLTSSVAVGGGSYLYFRRLRQNKSISAEEFNAKQDQQELESALLNLFANDKNHQRPIVRMYRFTTCPFCGIVKAFLDCHKINHELVEVDPMFKTELSKIEYKKVPQLQFIMTGHWGPFLVDSELIIKKMAKYVSSEIEAQLNDQEVKKWRSWARNELVRFLVLNINRTLIDAWKGYDYIDNFDTIPYVNKLFLKAIGAPVMYMVARLKTRPAMIEAGLLTKDGNEDMRAKLLESINKFTEEGLKSKLTHSVKDSSSKSVNPSNGKDGTGSKVEGDISPFHGGNKPDLADIDVYGVMQSIRGHVLYDDIISSNKKIGEWLARMDIAAGKETPYVVNLNKNAY